MVVLTTSVTATARVLPVLACRRWGGQWRAVTASPREDGSARKRTRPAFAGDAAHRCDRSRATRHRAACASSCPCSSGRQAWLLRCLHSRGDLVSREFGRRKQCFVGHEKKIAPFSSKCAGVKQT
eukprot:scaffold17729_cov80-Isochrysis_galbana.AAC.1